MIDQSITWDSIYRAIRSEQNGREVYQGVVTDRNLDLSCIWVRELSSDPIEVVGHDHEITYFDKGVQKTARIAPAIPDIGDVVTLVKTASDQFKCVGTQQTTRKWSADHLFGYRLLPGVDGQFLETQAGVPTWADFTPSTGVAASYSATIGDGTTTVFTVTHSLNINDVMVAVREVGGDQSFVDPEIRKRWTTIPSA